jgi:hypothetical protein
VLTVFAVVAATRIAFAFADHDQALADPSYAERLELLRRRCPEDRKPFVVVALGSSHTQYAVRAAMMGESLSQSQGRTVAAFNFAREGGCPFWSLYTYRRLRRDGVRPDLVLLEVFPIQLGINMGLGTVEDVLPAAAVPWADYSLVNRYVGHCRPNFKREWLSSHLAPWYGHRRALLSRWAPPLVAKKSFVPPYNDSGDVIPSWPDVTAEARARNISVVQRDIRQRHGATSLHPLPCGALRELLTACRDDGVKVVLVVMPEGGAFRSAYPPELWDACRDFLGGLQSEFGVPAINAREWFPAEGHYFDSHHLLHPGAVKFTHRLTHQVIEPYLRHGLAAFREAPAAVDSFPVSVGWEPGFGPLELGAGKDWAAWHWCHARRGELTLNNYADEPVPARLRMRVYPGGGKGTVSVRGSLLSEEWAMTPTGTSVDRTLVLPPGRHSLVFEASGPPLVSGPARLWFRIDSLTLKPPAAD